MKAMAFNMTLVGKCIKEAVGGVGIRIRWLFPAKCLYLPYYISLIIIKKRQWMDVMGKTVFIYLIVGVRDKILINPFNNVGWKGLFKGCLVLGYQGGICLHNGRLFRGLTRGPAECHHRDGHLKGRL